MLLSLSFPARIARCTRARAGLITPVVPASSGVPSSRASGNSVLPRPWLICPRAATAERGPAARARARQLPGGLSAVWGAPRHVYCSHAMALGGPQRPGERVQKEVRMPRILMPVFALGLAWGVVACASARATFGNGDVEYSIPDTGGEDETAAKVIGLRLENDPGDKTTGLEGELWLSEDDLFGTDAELRALELTWFAEWVKERSDVFRTSFLLGLDYHSSRTAASAGDLTWSTLGLKAAFGPELALLRTKDRALTIGLEGSYMIGLSSAEAGGVESASLDTGANQLGLEAMVAYGDRATFSVGAGVIYRKFTVDTVEDDSGSFDIAGIETELTAVVLRAQIDL
jgi:hypothetical protein